MDLYNKSFLRGSHVYYIGISLSSYRFLFFPTIDLRLTSNDNFSLTIGLFTFMIEIIKTDKKMDDNIKRQIIDMLTKNDGEIQINANTFDKDFDDIAFDPVSEDDSDAEAAEIYGY